MSHAHPRLLQAGTHLGRILQGVETPLGSQETLSEVANRLAQSRGAIPYSDYFPINYLVFMRHVRPLVRAGKADELKHQLLTTPELYTSFIEIAMGKIAVGQRERSDLLSTISSHLTWEGISSAHAFLSHLNAPPVPLHKSPSPLDSDAYVRQGISYIKRNIFEKKQFLPPEFERDLMDEEEQRSIAEALEQPTIATYPTFSFSMPRRSLFYKWVAPHRVPRPDHELLVADALDKKGIGVENDFGVLQKGGDYYLIIEKNDGIDFRNVFYTDNLLDLRRPDDEPRNPGRFLSILSASDKAYRLTSEREVPAITADRYREETTRAYQALGATLKEVRQCGVALPDLCPRNVMLSYFRGKPQVTLIDFEHVDLETDWTEEQFQSCLATFSQKADPESYQALLDAYRS